jgi:hypothetical protein
MRRRTFSKLMLSDFLLLALPKWVHPAWARARGADPPVADPRVADPAQDTVALDEVAGVVLPASLGPQRIGEIVAQFQQWIRDYPAGADAGYGYGISRPRVLGPNPAMHYTEHLRQISDLAAAKGMAFSALNETAKRGIVEAAFTQAGVTAIPAHPNGRHVATDLMSFFYNSSFGEDFCYNAAIQRENCRGLSTSGQRPAPLNFKESQTDARL